MIIFHISSSWANSEYIWTQAQWHSVTQHPNCIFQVGNRSLEIKWPHVSSFREAVHEKHLQCSSSFTFQILLQQIIKSTDVLQDTNTTSKLELDLHPGSRLITITPCHDNKVKGLMCFIRTNVVHVVQTDLGLSNLTPYPMIAVTWWGVAFYHSRHSLCPVITEAEHTNRTQLHSWQDCWFWKTSPAMVGIPSFYVESCHLLNMRALVLVLLSVAFKDCEINLRKSKCWILECGTLI